jgi:ferritin-like metal-binding protein YciE
MGLGNLSPTERWVSTLSGFGLIMAAVPRGSWFRRLAFTAGGATLVSRGFTGYCGMKAALTGDANSLRSGLREQWQRARSQVGAGAAGIDSLEALHLEEMQELASSTAQLGRLLDELERSIDHTELRRSVQSYATQVHSRSQDIERTLTTRGASPGRHPDQAMQALVEEARKMMRIASPTVRDAALVDSVQRLIHYQIAGQGSAAAHAKALGRDQEASQIADWADRDKAIDASLTELAMGLLNPHAAGGTGAGAGSGAASRATTAATPGAAAGSDTRTH